MTDPRRAVALLLRLTLGLLLVWAGETKLFEGQTFASEVANYRFFAELAPWLAFLLPGVELATGVVLLAGGRVWVRAASLVAGLLMATFTVAVAQVLARGINISCGCFGGVSGPVTLLTLGRDLALLGGAVVLYVLSAPTPVSTPSPLPSPQITDDKR